MAFNTNSIGAAYGKIVTGTTTVTSSGTAVRVTTTSTPIGGVWVGGDIGNSNVVVVGDSSVVGTSGSQQGLIIGPAESSVFLPINNLDLLYVDAAASGDELTWLYLQPTDAF